MKFLIYFLLAFISFPVIASEFSEKYKRNETLTYQETIQHYKNLADRFETARLFEYGKTDAGEPLHLFVISKDKIFDPDSIKAQGKAVMLVMNAIHPGEPCGVDASAKLAEDLLTVETTFGYNNSILCIIPAYSIGGMLNRSCCSRANQNGPKEYGFRGNAKNLDLNRDFIKADALNTKSFYEIFHEWEPDFFVDTHSTNGADYPAELTLISTVGDRMEKSLGDYFYMTVIGRMYKGMEFHDFQMSPYVYMYGDSIEQGLKEYLDSPRYSTGFANLFNTMGFVTEAHMLKPYPKRVEATKQFLFNLYMYSAGKSLYVRRAKKSANDSLLNQTKFGINYKLDTTKFNKFTFFAYDRKNRISNVTDLNIHYYDTTKIDTLKPKYYSHYLPQDSVLKPKYYIIPQAWKEVIERLKWNKIKMERVKKDSTYKVEAYRILDYETSNRAYEGHYLHSNVKFRIDTMERKVRKGDYLVPTDQIGIKYLIETLEPHAKDSFFAWNFFDTILQQKEWFSSYLFEPKAEEILNSNQRLKTEFEMKKANDKEFASSNFRMLYYIYKNSKYYEDTHNLYPVFRVPLDEFEEEGENWE